MPWPLSLIDQLPAATRRRGIKFFRVVLAVMVGGTGLLVAGAWVLVVVVIGFAAFAYGSRGRYGELVGAVDRLGSDVYAGIEQARIFAARIAAARIPGARTAVARIAAAGARNRRLTNSQADPGV